ncbi:unnamed protein product [Rhizoctonia solani]|uniref:Uncharacterized protein n=1 Tax=Rhizoctonia solani TaxID=456999 RepID=A0A8H3E653_9AGAM|nr:unnamed protein product [Rhizoctonia solani]
MGGGDTIKTGGRHNETWVHAERVTSVSASRAYTYHAPFSSPLRAPHLDATQAQDPYSSQTGTSLPYPCRTSRNQQASLSQLGEPSRLARVGLQTRNRERARGRSPCRYPRTPGGIVGTWLVFGIYRPVVE